MHPDQLHEHLNKLVYGRIPRARIEAEIEEHVESEEERIAAYELLEELYVDLELAKQSRAKVRDNFLISTIVFLVAIGASAYAFSRLNGGFLLIYVVMLIAAAYAVRYLVQLQNPLEAFSPRRNKEPARLIKKRL